MVCFLLLNFWQVFLNNPLFFSLKEIEICIHMMFSHILFENIGYSYLEKNNSFNVFLKIVSSILSCAYIYKIQIQAYLNPTGTTIQTKKSYLNLFFLVYQIFEF
jgi:hypothetical protein